VLLVGCGNTVTTPPNNASLSPTPTPAPSPTQEKTVASPTPTPKNLAEAFYGEWEREDNGKFTTVKFSSATQKGDDFVGTMIDVNTKKNTANYTVQPNNNVTLTILPGNPNAGESYTVEYEVSDDGNSITLKRDPPQVFKKGTSSADILKDVTTISTLPDWKPDAQARSYFEVPPAITLLHFGKAIKYDEGYTGDITGYDGAVQTLGKYTITSKGKITTSHNGNKKSAKYTLVGDNILRIEFTDGGSALNFTR
jgi:hypothetical protein